MSVTAKDIIDIATEAEPVIEGIMERAEILAGFGKVCREKGIDWAQLKALIKARIRDRLDETGDGGHVERIIEKADAASAYADMLANMNKKSFSSEPVTEPTRIPGTRVSVAAGEIDTTIPDFLRRTGVSA